MTSRNLSQHCRQWNVCGVRSLPYYVAQYSTYQGKGTGVPVLN